MGTHEVGGEDLEGGHAGEEGEDDGELSEEVAGAAVEDVFDQRAREEGRLELPDCTAHKEKPGSASRAVGSATRR